jgi:hypothetical protein
MRCFRPAMLAMVSVLAVSQTARADALWFDPPLTTPIAQGQWFFGIGAIGGTYRAPKWNGTFTHFNGTSPDGPNEFTARNFMIGPGGTVGYTFNDGALPPWIGTRARIAFSGMWWSGDRTQSKSKSFSAADIGNYHTVDGRVFFSAAAGVPGNLNETLRTEFNAYELALRLSADRPLTPTLTLIQSLGVFGGSSVERYQSTSTYVTLAGVNSFPGFINERVVSSRIGADAGLGLSWQIMPSLRWGVGGRAGFHWVRSNLEAGDCGAVGAVAACGFSPNTFIPGAGFGTTTSSSRSTIGFRGSVGSSITLDGGWIQASLGGFFTFDSASPGIANPTSNTVGLAPGTNVGAARIRFAGGYNAGGFFTIKVQLP